jgi:hypothetical protein
MLLAAAATASGGGRQTQPRIERTFTIPPGKPVTVEATVADVTISAWARPEVSVIIERRAERDADLSLIPVRLEDEPDALHLSTRQLDGPPDRGLRVSITIRAPARTPFASIAILDGRLVLEGLIGSVTADLKQGSIEGSRLGGTIRLETGLGSVEVREAELTPGGLLRLRAFNGSATLRLAAVPANARILALSFNGRVSSDIPLTMKETFGPRFGEATLGKGEPVISLDAVYGDVVIRVEKQTRGAAAAGIYNEQDEGKGDRAGRPFTGGSGAAGAGASRPLL